MTTETPDWLKKVQERRGTIIPVSPQKPVMPSVPTAPVPVEDIPDVLNDGVSAEEKRERTLVDDVVEKIGVLEGYRKWIGKTVDPRTEGNVEGIKVSCPQPDHRDNDPSAWLNSDSKTWFCGGCQIGGDIFDLAAIGHSVNYKNDARAFVELKNKMAEDFGYKRQKVLGSFTEFVDDSKAPEAYREDQPTQPVIPDPMSSVETDEDEDDEFDELNDLAFPVIDWRGIIPKDTFVYEYMKVACEDDAPEEFHFWYAMVGLGLIAGRDVTLFDSPPVKANLAVCMLGKTSAKKTTSRRHLDHIIQTFLPFEYSDGDDYTSGIKRGSGFASGEVIVDHFAHPVTDANGKPTGKFASVTGLVLWDEMSSLMAIGNRQGSNLKDVFQELYDAHDSKPLQTASRGHGNVSAPTPFGSMLTSTQPSSVRHLLNKKDAAAGFINRWLFVGGNGKPPNYWSRGGIPDYTEVHRQIKMTQSWFVGGKQIPPPRQGSVAEIETIKDFEELKLLKDDDNSDSINRIDLTLKKLYLLFCINERSDELTEDIVLRVRILKQYLLDCYGILDTSIASSQMDDLQEKIMRYLREEVKKRQMGVTALGLKRFLKGSKVPLPEIERALTSLKSVGAIDAYKPRKGPGRPPKDGGLKFKLAGAEVKDEA